eukprot:CAMPEP_0119222080 /NCGR_PEP_ID=MMETSP1327-20130426/29863_1 /TAXON_ID=38833 /ORGANISM="Micromonas pusilla, Strain RCC2306" /LENGTH=109 /DNA_ID=CAMNT_0007220275 /DNA_START=46 /DNA_END=373 /DNA_ORIENTATION=+
MGAMERSWGGTWVGTFNSSSRKKVCQSAVAKLASNVASHPSNIFLEVIEFRRLAKSSLVNDAETATTPGRACPALVRVRRPNARRSRFRAEGFGFREQSFPQVVFSHQG